MPAVAAAAGAGAATATQAKPAQAGANAGTAAPGAPAPATAAAAAGTATPDAPDKPGTPTTSDSDTGDSAAPGSETDDAVTPDAKPDGADAAPAATPDAKPDRSRRSRRLGRGARGGRCRCRVGPAGRRRLGASARSFERTRCARRSRRSRHARGRPPGRSTPVPPARSGQRAPVRPMLPPRPMPQQTAIIPPQRRDPWYRRLLANPRYIVLAVAGVLIVGGGAVYGLNQASDDGGEAPAGNQAPWATAVTPTRVATRASGNNRRPVVPDNVTVAVLNGTTVPGLAEAGGRRGRVTRLPARHRGEHGGPGAAARRVGRPVRAGPRARGARGEQAPRHRPARAIDAASQELAGDATVVVIAGADLAQ